MRRFTGWILMLMIILVLGNAGATGNMLHFETVDLADQRLDVYGAPSEGAWRGAKGKAAVDTSDTVWTAGRDGNWMLVVYEINKGYRSGYVYIKEIRGQVPDVKELTWIDEEIQVTRKSSLTDDPWGEAKAITTLKKGSKVRLLAFTGDDQLYVETRIKKKTVRGFIPAANAETRNLTPEEDPEDSPVILETIPATPENGLEENESSSGTGNRTETEAWNHGTGVALPDGQNEKEPVNPNGGALAPLDHGASYSQATKAGCNWYGFDILYMDDYGYIGLHATDDRGYLKSCKAGFAHETIREIVGISSTGTRYHVWRVEAWELANGDIFVQFVESRQVSPKGSKKYELTTPYYSVVRPCDRGFEKLAEWAPEEPSMDGLEECFREWGLRFSESFTVVSMGNLRNGENAITIPGLDQEAVTGCTYIGYADSREFNLPQYKDVEAEGKAHFRADETAEAGTVEQVVEDVRTAGIILTQQNLEERVNIDGKVTEIWKTYGTPRKGSVRFETDAETGEILKVVIMDQKQSVVYRKVGQVQKLETTQEMKMLYHAIIRSAGLHIEPDVAETLNQYDLAWTETIEQTQEFSVKGTAEAGPVHVEFYRQYWRIVTDVLNVTTTIRIDR